jgi:hypothetical protein
LEDSTTFKRQREKDSSEAYDKDKVINRSVFTHRTTALTVDPLRLAIRFKDVSSATDVDDVLCDGTSLQSYIKWK